MLLQTIPEGPGLTTKEKIKRNALRFKAICIPVYLAYVLLCMYVINGAQSLKSKTAAAAFLRRPQGVL